jgi:hypothetical protein
VQSKNLLRLAILWFLYLHFHISANKYQTLLVLAQLEGGAGQKEEELRATYLLLICIFYGETFSHSHSHLESYRVNCQRWDSLFIIMEIQYIPYQEPKLTK